MTTIIDDPILRQGEQWKQEIAARQAQSAANIETVVAPAAVAEPDAAPEVTAFMRRASILIERGIPVAPLPPNRKMAPPSNWEKIATTDLTALAAMNPHADGNTAAVARAEFGGFCFFEVDRPNFHLTIQEQTGKKFPETLLISSSPGKGRGHFYWKHTAKSIALGNAQAKDERGELWSFRADRRYVVGPLSVKDDGTVYTIIKDHPIADCPDWLVEWIAANAENKKTGHAELDSEEPIAEGSRNNTLTSIAGRARQLLKMDKEELYQYLSSQNQKRCRPPLPESEVRTISTSVAGYAVKEVGQLVFPPSQQPAQAPNQPEEIAPVKLTKIPYPVFPEWVMKGTSLYEGFVRPVCAVNSRIPYFMFVPAAALMMNYLGNKVKVEQRNQIPSFFIVLIGEKGRAIKSSSVEDAIEYLQVAQIIEHAGNDTKNAGGKSLVWTVGSPEGLGLEMSRTNCGNAVLFYDELTTLTSKAEIDSSSLKSSLLTLYESGKFSNTIKSRKEAFSINPKSYCATLIACTPDGEFEDNWSRLCGKSSGLDDRFIFLLQPKQLPELTPKIDVNTVEGSMKTKALIEKAVLQKEYQFEDTTPLEGKIGELGNRTEIRAEKWALYFAVDLGRDSIDEDCVERGIAMARYEKAVKKYLGSPEAETKIAAAQIKYRRILERKFDGRAKTRDMARAMTSSRYGTEGWWRIEEGLKKAGIIAEIGGDKPGTIKEVVVRISLDE